MASRRFVRKAQEWSEVARWLGVFWPCRCAYSNVASYRCYYCGKRAPVEVRTLVADTILAADRILPVEGGREKGAHSADGGPAEKGAETHRGGSAAPVQAGPAAGDEAR
jgi:hypothetical protein